ncbi:MAG TPA: stage II sporulation protein D, partial [Bacillota bacterium]
MRVALRLLLLIGLGVSILVLGLPLYLAGLGSGYRLPASRVPVAAGDLPIRVYLDREKRVEVMPLETYVKGVVAAEMPASFHLEALKAQAVVARTYAVRRMRIFGGSGCPQHPAADACTDPATGQAYATSEELRQRWGVVSYVVNWERIESAVEATRGLILTFDGEPIDAVYHSTSGGQTAAAQEVWGEAVPYLRSVPSPHEERSPKLQQTLRLTLSELAAKLDLPADLVRQHARAGRLIEASRSESGRVRSAAIAGRSFEVAELRQRLALNSNWFTWRLDGD